MALKIGDRVRENTNSTGVGGLSLTGAPAGFQRFSAILSSGDTTYYALEENDKFEVGIGTYGSNNLERTTILSSSNSGNKISLGGSGVVFITYPAAKAFFASAGDEFTVPASGLVFSNGTVIKDAKLVELSDVNLTGTPTDSSVVDLNITNKSLTIGDRTGAANSNNTIIGYGAGSGITTSTDSVVIGAEASTKNKTGQHNVHIGAKAGPIASDAAISVYNSVALGYSAGNKMRHESVAIGYEAAKDAYEIGFVGIGYQVGDGLGSYSTIVGYQAGNSLGEDYAVALGYQAGFNGAGESAIWIGHGAGTSSTGSTRSIGIGKNAGKSSSGTECIYLGEGAGTSNSSNNLVFIGNSTPATNGTLIKGDMDSKRVAIGAADVTLDDTLFVGVNAANDEGIVVKAAASQVSNLTSWKNSSDAVLASVDKDGIISGHGIHASGNGIEIASATPASTSNKVYADGTDLYWNGSKVAVGTTPTFTNINVGQYIYHDGDSNTYIRFRGDQIDLVAGNLTMLTLDEASTDKVTVNNGANNIDFQVKGDNDTNLIRTDAANDLVGIGTSTPAYKLDIVGHGAIMQASGVVVGNSGIVLANNVPSVTTNTLYNEGGTLKFSGSTIGGVDTYTSGVATYASGQAISNQSNIATNTSNISTNTARVSYASGQAISNQSNITALLSASGTATSLISSSGIATYASGQAVSNQSSIATNASNISTNTSNISTNTARVNYASGQAIANESDIAALLTASGTATSLIASSGIATYASGQAIANESDIVAVSGIAAYASGVGGGGGDVTTAQLNYVSGIAVYSSGLAITNEAEVTYASGLAITNEGRVNYASGQAISNQSNITALNTASGIATSLLAVSGTATSLVATSGIATYASGQAIANESDIVATSGISAYASGLAITNEGRVNYASGQAIENESDLVAVSGIANYASGQINVTTDGTAEASKALVLDSAKSFTGVKDGRFSQFDSFVYSTGVSIGNSGVLLSRNTPDVTTDTLYNVGGTLYFNGSQLASAGGASATAQYASGQATSLNTASGVATYASGQAIANESDIVATSGIANYASGQAISNQGNITALLTASGTATSLIASSGIATYASGQAIANEGDLVAVSGIAAYASGVSLTVKEADNNPSVANVRTIVVSNGTLTDNGGGQVTLTTGGGGGGGDVTTTQLNYVSGIAVYASGQSQSLNTVSGVATSLLAVSGTATSLISTSGIAAYASGQAIANESDIATNTSNISTNTSNISTNTARVNYASGQAISNQSNITALLSASGTATSLIASSGIATYASGQAIANESDIVATSGISAYASGLAITNEGRVSYASGQAIANEGDLVAVSGIAAYASGVSLTVKEADNNPNVANVRTIVVSNGTLTDNGGGQVTLTTGGGGGGGDVSTAQLNYVSGIAVYGSGQSTSLNTASGIATALINSSGVATYASGQVNVSVAGTATASKALVLDSAKSFTGAKHGVFNQFDSRLTASGITIGASGVTLTGGAYVQEAVPANDTPTAEDATVTLDLSTGNFHNISLGQNVTKFEFTNAKRGQRFILRITQNGSSAKTVAWTNVDYTTGGAAATVRWAGNVVPTMSTSTSHTDVYGFLCTNNAGSNFDGFIIGQDLPD